MEKRKKKTTNQIYRHAKSEVNRKLMKSLADWYSFLVKCFNWFCLHFDRQFRQSHRNKELVVSLINPKQTGHLCAGAGSAMTMPPPFITLYILLYYKYKVQSSNLPSNPNI